MSRPVSEQLSGDSSHSRPPSSSTPLLLLHLCPPPPLSLQKYVQDALREQLSDTVYRCLREEGGHMYVCGDVTMAGDVLKTVQHIIKQQGNMSLEDAGFFISRLRVRETEQEMMTQGLDYG